MENNPASYNNSSIKKKNKSVFREYAEAIFIALLLALFIRTFIIQAFKIPSGSMKNTLLIGDHILVSKFAYGTHIPNVIPFLNIKLFDDIVLFQKTPKREDIIVFKYPKNENRDFIKRVIGIPGDLLEVRQQKVYINEELKYDELEKLKIVPDKELIKKFPDEIFVPKNVSEPIINRSFNNILSILSKKVKKKII